MRYCNWSEEYPIWRRCLNEALPGGYRCEEHKITKPYRQGGLTHAQKQAIREKFGYKCAVCGDYAVEVDHIVEFSEFYDQRMANRVENLQLLCTRHHEEKTNAFRKSRIQEPDVFDRSTSARNRKKKRQRKQGFYRT